MCQSIQDLAQAYSQFVVKIEDFKLGKQIGKGGFSEVYVGEHRQTGLPCAIKILKYKNLRGDKFLLYDREIETLAKCSNGFLLGLVGFSAVHPFIIVTEYVPNGSLYDALRTDDPSKSLDGTQKTLIAMGIANGIRRLHKLGIIHRDIKSLNILLDADLLPKICDFGLARQMDEKAELMTTKVGTVHWMAPELFENQPYDNKVDVYAYGMLLWEILTGKSPFKGMTQVQIAFAVCKNNKRPSFPMMTPSHLKALINSCWNQDPKKRPTMKQIFHVFSKGKVSFHGTIPQEVGKFVSQIKQINKEHKAMANNKINPSLASRFSKSYTLPPELRIEEKVRVDPISQSDLDALSEATKETFKEALDNVVNRLSSDSATKFFNAILPHLHPATDPEILGHLFDTLDSLFSKDDAYFHAFVNKKILNRLLVPGESLTPKILQILLHVFTKSPIDVDPTVLNYVISCSGSEPMKALRLINLYSCHQPPLEHFWIAADALVMHAATFLSAGLSEPLFTLIHTISSLHSQFAEARIEYILGIIKETLSQPNDNGCKAAYELLCTHEFPGTVLDSAATANHLRNPFLSEHAVSAIVRAKDYVPTADVLSALLDYAASSELASLCLCRMSEDVSTSDKLAASSDRWLLGSLPTTDGTLRLLLVLLSKESSMRILVSSRPFPAFLTKLSSLDSHLFLEIFHLTMMSTDFTMDMLQRFDREDVLSSYFETVTKTTSSTDIINCFSLTGTMLSVGYTPGFKKLMPLLVNLLREGNTGWIEYAAPVLVSLSYFKESHADLAEYGILQLFERFGKEPNVASYVEAFKNNLKNM